MVVDDHADTRDLLRFAIETSGYRVVEASDGEEAVRLAETMLPDLILMDTSLPRVDGYMATERIRKLKNENTVTIIFLSGHAEQQSQEMALAAGGDHYFVKPVNLEELGLTLAKHLRLPPSAIYAEGVLVDGKLSFE
jgi:CheY-like chemotaxis protein